MGKKKTVTIETTAPQTTRTRIIGGVEFTDGKATVDADDRRVDWFRRRGYRVAGKVRDQDTAAERTDARKAGVRSRGTLRDAAVDPKKPDFLPPTNAGKADPHGPDVVSPEVHASPSGPKPVVPGPVSDDADAQEDKEKAAVEDAATPFDPDGGTVAEVNAYLETADDDERARVLDVEAAGQNRKGIVEGPHAGDGS